jgi:hypothetical protein
MSQVIAWLLQFFEDDAGNKSSSRLIAIGGATAMAVYLLAGKQLETWGLTGWSDDLAADCVWGLTALGGVVYGANRLSKAKEQQNAE